MKFSLVHPSRHRVPMAEKAIAEWTGKHSGRTAYEYLLSVDSDDTNLAEYEELAARRDVRLLVSANRSLVDAVNNAVRLSDGDVVIVVSDDFSCPDQWDLSLQAVVGDERNAAVLVHDGIDGRILTLPIVGRALYERLGFIYHPEYRSLFADDDLTEAARRYGKVIDARHLVFQHNHYAVGRNPLDETYARENSSSAWLVGWRIFNKRRLAEFGLRRRSAGLLVQQAWVDLQFYVRRALISTKRIVRRS